MLARSKFSILICLFLCFASCAVVSSDWPVPETLLGTWQAAPAAVTVRTSPRWMHFEFTTDTVAVTITIHADNSVSGRIGNTAFTNGSIRINRGNPERTGVGYIITCGVISNIFSGDPLPDKEIEIWLSPAASNMPAELRQTENHGVFPMGAVVFEKIDNE